MPKIETTWAVATRKELAAKKSSDLKKMALDIIASKDDASPDE